MGQELGAGFVLLTSLPQEKSRSIGNCGPSIGNMITAQDPLPRLAQVLGYAGLIPFVVLAAMAWTLNASEQALATFALRAYAVTIVSFLRAIHWGLAMRQSPANPLLLWWGIAPSLVGWVSLLLVPAAGSLILAATLWLCFLVDRRVYPTFGLRAWLRMRLVLTTVASAACAISSGIG
jgi:hypothetical protein